MMAATFLEDYLTGILHHITGNLESF